MKYNTLLILLILLLTSITLATAEAIEFSCPDSIPVNEEFTCTIKILEGEGIYDVKLNVVDIDGKSVIRVLHGETWKSGFYYLKEFVEVNEEKEIGVIGKSEGNYESVVKIRKGSFQESFPFTIGFGEEEIQESNSEDKEGEVETQENEPEEELTKEETKSPQEEATLKPKETIPQVISLNQPEDTLEETAKIQEASTQPVYVSKNSKILHAAPYAFSIFLMIIIGFLLWERF